MHTIVKDYRNDDKLRQSFNELAGNVFGLNFEYWYQSGFWGDNYNPYSIVMDDKVVANVSVNRTDMRIGDEVKHFIQLGTVMTDEAYRNQGLIRKIMEQIEMDHLENVDGMYLFASDSVLDFYPKFGFEKSVEYQYSKKVTNTGACQLEQVIMNHSAAWNSLQDVMDNNVFRGACDMVNNDGLIFFYASQFMQECVFYHKDSETYVIAEPEGESLFIHNVFSKTMKNMDDVIELFGTDIKEVTLGFAPEKAEGYEVQEFHEEDCTFFAIGAEMDVIKEKKLRIPTLSHA